MSCPGQCAQSKGGKSVKAGRASRGPACFCLGAATQSPRGWGTCLPVRPPFPSAASRGSPAAGLPAAHSLVRQFGLPLGAVLSQRGTGIGAARETHSSRRPVSENRRFSIRLFTRRGNSAGRPGRELQAVRLHRGRIPRPGCFNGILGPAPQDRHESRPCPHGQGPFFLQI